MGIYGIRIRDGGVYYEDVVYANSWEEAEAKAELLGGEVTGELSQSFGNRFDKEEDEWN